MESSSLRHYRWIQTCLRLAERNHKAYPYRYAGILVKGGRIVRIGFNRIKNNRLTSNSFYRCKTVHCEVDVLRNIDDVRGCTLYIAGITKAGNLINCCPCSSCQEFLNEYFRLGLKNVFYLDCRGRIREYKEGSVGNECNQARERALC